MLPLHILVSVCMLRVQPNFPQSQEHSQRAFKDMVKLSDIDLNDVKEIYCRGGSEGFRTVFVRQNEKEHTQKYWTSTTRAFTKTISLDLEGVSSVNFDGGELIVVGTKEILVPYSAYMLDGSILEIDVG